MKPQKTKPTLKEWLESDKDLNKEPMTDLEFMNKAALTIPIVGVSLVCEHCSSDNVTKGDSGLWCDDCGKLTIREN